jgi:hypothetical protein
MFVKVKIYRLINLISPVRNTKQKVEQTQTPGYTTVGISVPKLKKHSPLPGYTHHEPYTISYQAE